MPLRTTSRPHPFLLLLVFVVLLATGLSQCACQPAPSRIQISLYYHSSLLPALTQELARQQAQTTITFKDLDFRYALQKRGEPADPAREQAGALAERSETPDNKATQGTRLAKLNCTKITADDVLQVTGYIKNKDNAQPVLVGSASARLLCQRLQARIQLLLPNRFNHWAAFQDRRKVQKGAPLTPHHIARVGHHVVTLPDGRIVFIGGLRTLNISETNTKDDSLFGDFVTRVDIYDPASGQMIMAAEKKEQGEVPMAITPRAFFAVAMVEDNESYKILLHGGLQGDKLGLADPQMLEISKKPEGFGVRTSTKIPEALAVLAKQPRAFHHIIQIQGKYAVVGGVSCNPSWLGEDRCAAPADQGELYDQHMFFTLTPHGKDQFLLVGGVFYSDNDDEWQEVPDFWVIQAKHIQNDGTIKLSNNDQFPLDEARGAHMILQVSPNAYLLYGGYRPQEGPLGLKNAKLVRNVELLRKRSDCQPDMDDCWHSQILDVETEKGETTLAPPRIFAQSTSFAYRGSRPVPKDTLEQHWMIVGGLKSAADFLSGTRGHGLAQHHLWLRFDPAILLDDVDEIPPLLIRHLEQPATQRRFFHQLHKLDGGQVLITGGTSGKRQGSLERGEARIFLSLPQPKLQGPNFAPQSPEFPGPDAGSYDTPPPPDDKSPDLAYPDPGDPDGLPPMDVSPPDTRLPDIGPGPDYGGTLFEVNSCNPQDQNPCPLGGECLQGLCWRRCQTSTSCPPTKLPGMTVVCQAAGVPGSNESFCMLQGCQGQARPDLACGATSLRCDRTTSLCVSKRMGTKEFDRCNPRHYTCDPSKKLFCIVNPAVSKVGGRCARLCDPTKPIHPNCGQGRDCKKIDSAHKLPSLPSVGVCTPIALPIGNLCKACDKTKDLTCCSNGLKCLITDPQVSTKVCVTPCQRNLNCLRSGTSGPLCKSLNNGNIKYCATTQGIQASKQAICDSTQNYRAYRCKEAPQTACSAAASNQNEKVCKHFCKSDGDCKPGQLCHLSANKAVYGFCR